MVNVDFEIGTWQGINDFWQTLLSSISQGVCVFDADGRVSQFNPCLSELLDVAPEFLASGPSLGEIYDFQMQRGDFAGAPHPLDQPARQASTDADPALVSEHYLRLKHLGRTLPVQTKRYRRLRCSTAQLPRPKGGRKVCFPAETSLNSIYSSPTGLNQRAL